MKIVSIVGARPQFIKAAPVSKVLRAAGHEEILVHTGQHYDFQMSELFFHELGIPQPKVNLGTGSGSHAYQTGQMLMGLEQVLLQQKPEMVLVYGDTNSTLAGALTAAKLQIRIAHVEAGLRSFNRSMPEELNRIVTDHLANLLFCPSETSAANLAAEGITKGVYVVGDVMIDAQAYALERAKAYSQVLEQLDLEKKSYLLATVHRAENTDNPLRMRGILSAFSLISEKIVFPVHPRTLSVLRTMGSPHTQMRHLKVIDPVGYLDMIRLQSAARLIITDSGGVQKEAYWLGVPCVTLREETEWVETVLAGWNTLVGTDPAKITAAVRKLKPNETRPPLYGDGKTAHRIEGILSSYD